MATVFVILCPECENQIKVNDQHVGKKIRCKECDHTFVVKKPKDQPKPVQPEPPAKKEPKVEEEEGTFKLKDEPLPPKPAVAIKPPEEEEENANPYSLAKNNDDTPRCPFCTNELESAAAVICKECGYNMITRRRVETKKVHEPTGQERFQWLLPGILCVVGILIAIVICIICYVKTSKWMVDSWFYDEDDKTFILKPGCFQLFNVMVTAYVCFALGRFAYKRLVVNPEPPERFIEEGDAEAANEAEAELEDDDD